MDSLDEWAEMAGNAMDAARAVVTSLLVDDPEAAVEVLKSLQPPLKFHVTLALGAMVANSMNALAEAYGHDGPLEIWQSSILATMAEPPEG